MRMKRMLTYIAMGVGGTLLYQQIRNGNAKKCIKDMEEFMKKTYDDVYDDLEDMMQFKNSQR